MNARPLVVTFTNLFPSAVRPTHGSFVHERMRRVMAAEPDWDWAVVSPAASAPWPLRRGELGDNARMPDRETVDGVTVHHPRYLHLPGLSLRAQARRMARASAPVVADLVRGRQAVLDVHYAYPDGVAAARIAEDLRVPFVVTARGTDVNVLALDPRVRPQLRAWLPRARALLAVSDAPRRAFAAAVGVADERVLLARNGVDLDRFAPGDAAAARRQLGLPSGPRLLLGVGRLIAGKGFLHLARVLDRLPPDVHAVLIEGPERERIAAAAPADRLHLLGARGRDEVATAMRAADLFVLPTAREGWPNVVTEALASGLPVVASAVGGIPEIVAAPVAGELVPPGDEGALAAALLRQLAQPADRAAVRAFAGRYSWQQPVSCLRGVLAAALGSP